MTPPARLRKGAHAEPDIARHPAGQTMRGAESDGKGGPHSAPSKRVAAQRRRRLAERRGHRAEAYAAFRLRLLGWRILARRARTPLGEIDIVARRRGVLAFVEVKARADWDAALGAVTPHQRGRIGQAAEHWLGMALARRPDLAHHEHRFDAVLIVGWRMRHMADAWRSDDPAQR